MMQKLLTKVSSLIKKNPKLHFFKPVVAGIDAFLYEVSDVTLTAPHIRDSIDLKRWMMLVVYSLLPCAFVAIWNTGLQSVVYSSADPALMQKYVEASQSFGGYFRFAFTDGRYISFLLEGLRLFLPIVLVSYIVGGAWEALFACIRKHEIAEGFLVTGILYALILPPTLPLWMVALGVSLGVIISKELFGGTGMNIVNPALTCRCFLYFAFPAYMTGQVWVGENPNQINQSLKKINTVEHRSGIDAYAQPSFLGMYNINRDIKRIHIDALAQYFLKKETSTVTYVENQLHRWSSKRPSLNQLSEQEFQKFITDPLAEGGLGLIPNYYQDAQRFMNLKYSQGFFTDTNLFFGNMLGSMGEVSKLAILLGAALLILTGIGSWRTMLAVVIGTIVGAALFKFGSIWIGKSQGAWNPAIFDFPVYKQFLIGGLLFGLVFMATEPVSSPAMNSAKWVYGILIGLITVLIRIFNPAYPEGVMLAILLANVFAPLIDHHAVHLYRRKKMFSVKRR